MCQLIAHYARSWTLQAAKSLRRQARARRAQVLPDALSAAAAMVLAAPPAHARAACDLFAEALAGSDDYARKGVLVRWYQALAARVAARS